MPLTELIDNIKGYFLYDPTTPMMFNTGVFLYTFLVFLGLYTMLAKRKTLRVLYVTAFSLFFYYKSSGLFFLLLILSTFIDYLLGLLIYLYHLDEVPVKDMRVGKNRETVIVDLETLTADHPHRSNKPWMTAIRKVFFDLVGLTLLWIDMLTSRLIADHHPARKRKLFLILSVVANLGLLAYFKYTNFFLDTINAFLTDPLAMSNVFLPVGISFFTFQTMSYTIDIYRGKLEPVSNILDFGFYVSFFPQLVAGPIVRARDFLPQIRDQIHITRQELGQALMLIIIGLFKKAIISDYISVNYVDRIFEAPALYSGFENLMGVYGYALQIYCDFSGYSDMAIGLGLLLGFRLPVNFNAPYQSSSIREFWRRWHISLSSWLRDYLYISLGGNRKGKVRTYLNLLLTMLLGGLWHGAAWRFVLWGALHGVALALDRLLKETNAWIRQQFSILLDKWDRTYIDEDGNTIEGKQSWVTRLRWMTQGWLPLVMSILGHLWGILFTFHFVCLAWIFFRASSYESGMEVIDRILNHFDGQIAWQVLTGYSEVFLLMLLGYLLHFLPDNVDKIVQKRFESAPMVLQSMALALMIWMVIQTQTAEVQPFIYFQF